MFGTQLMAAPVVSPLLPQLKQAKHPVWFPQGDWFNFFTGAHISGSQWKVQLYQLDEIPLFAKAGAIVPLQHDVTSNGCANPQIIDLHIFPLADGAFELYEDDGISQRYKSDGGCITRFQSAWQENQLEFSILPTEGNIAAIPQERTYNLHFKGIRQPHEIILNLANQAFEGKTSYHAETNTLILHDIRVLPAQQLTVVLRTKADSLLASSPTIEIQMENLLHRLPLMPDQKRDIMNLLPELVKDIRNIEKLKLPIHKQQKEILIEVLTGVAAAPLTSPTGKKQFVFCNPEQISEFIVQTTKKIKIPLSGILLEKQNETFEINYFNLINSKF